MENVIKQYLVKMLEFEEKGYIDEAFVLSNKIIESFPEEKEIIILEKAKMEFRNGYEKEALIDLLTAYNISENIEIYQLILDAYLVPNKEELLKRLDSNQELLKEYPHYRNEEINENIKIFPIWQDDQLLIYVDIELKKFGVWEKIKKKTLPDKTSILMLVNELWIDQVLLCEESCRLKKHFMDNNIPMYLVYDQVFWIIFIQVYDLEQLITKDRIVFLIGTKSCKSYFYDNLFKLPDCFIYNGFQGKYDKVMTEIQLIITDRSEQDLMEINNYYKTHKEIILERIKLGTPRILFMTSRFTTALQYHTRDCMQAANRLGCEVELLIEKDNIHGITDTMVHRKISELKPDMIFCIDHFRFEIPASVPTEIVHICWVQDTLPHIMNEKTPMRLTARDIVLNHYTTWEEFKKIGYDERHLIDAPIPANPYIYKPYQLTEKEYKEYGCDLCFVCHKSDVDAHITELFENWSNPLKEACSVVYKGYQDYVYATGNIFYEKDVIREFIKGALKQSYHIILNDKIENFLVNDIFLRFNYIMFKQVLVDWLIEEGFTNIKLWGNGWKTSDKYKKYAMGPAENGEVLSKIYQASKIVVGNNCMSTSAARAWESMLSGAFYISPFIPPDADITDIRKIAKVDEEIVMFYNKTDFLQKIRYYLSHEEERQRMIQIGYKIALERMTYDRLMKKVLEEIPEKLERLKEWKE